MSAATHDSLNMGLTDIAEAIRARRTSASTVVEAHIDALMQRHDELNAVVATSFRQAREDAKRIDLMLDATSAGEPTPALLGVPFTVKEFFAVRGMPHTGGSLHRRGVFAEHDSPIVQNLRDSGAILLGLTNCPEGGLWLETDNQVYGRTNNPWDVSRTCGGSSGGEGVAVAIGGSALGVGADVGGSIRFPAAFCGVVGHKPTGGLIPTEGHWPRVGEGELPVLTAGPLVRYVRDVLPALNAMRGRGDALKDDARALSELKVFTPSIQAYHRVDGAVQRAVSRSVTELGRRGARIDDRPMRFLLQGLEGWVHSLLGAGGKTFGELMNGGRPIQLSRELLAAPFGASRHTAPVLTVLLLEKILGGMAASQSGPEARLNALRQRLEDTLGDNGVLVSPVYPVTAPKHGHPFMRPFGFVWSAAFNALHFPSTVVPVGTDRHGLPLCVQVIGARGADALTVRVAEQLEASFGGWQRVSATGSQGGHP